MSVRHRTLNVAADARAGFRDITRGALSQRELIDGHQLGRVVRKKLAGESCSQELGYSARSQQSLRVSGRQEDRKNTAASTGFRAATDAHCAFMLLHRVVYYR